MFICRDCITEYYIHFDNGWAMVSRDRLTATSHGPCEHCRKVATCIDVPHGKYAHKDSIYAKENILKEDTQ